MRYYYSIGGGDAAPLSEVGGKGRSLMNMAGMNLPVPPGIILTVGFFDPWLESLHTQAEWKKLPSADENGIKETTAALKAHAETLRFTSQQLDALHSGFSEAKMPEDALYAVRSSSPEEDLENASFAGVYETILGVKPEFLEDAVRAVFISALDERAFLYKKQHGFDISSIRIAIVIQHQIPSDVAGVGFSQNPITNCYDEIVINANYGLGESIVSGAASPDIFVIDKVTKEIVGKQCGRKEISFILLPDGGTKTRTNPPGQSFSLTDTQVSELAEMIAKVEIEYHMPVDTEWALYDDSFYLLQARPITTSIPIPEIMMTSPGEKRRLYIDLTLVEQGVQKALTPMGAEWFGEVLALMMTRMTGINEARDPARGIGGTAGGRTYLNLSTLLWVMDKNAVASEFGPLDATVAEVMETLDENRYKSENKPAYLRGVILSGLFKSAGLISKTLEGIVAPDHFNKKYLKGVEEYLKKIGDIEAETLSVKDYYLSLTQCAVDLMLKVTVPTLIDAEMAKSSIQSLFRDEPDDIRKAADKLDRALDHNLTTGMGLEMANLSRMFSPDEFSDIETLSQKVREGLPPETKQKWDAFMDRFGFRGPLEIDLASPRFVEDLSLLLSQMRTFSTLSDDMDPNVIFDRQKSERQEAAAFLETYLGSISLLKKTEFKKLYHILDTFGGYRESHKYYLVMASFQIRQRILQEARLLTENGRLEKPEDVFFLTIDQLASGIEDSTIDLKSLVQTSREEMKPFNAVPAFPALIDSRGTILRPPRQRDIPGRFNGDAISAGVVSGPAKILRSPGEKPVYPGDILIIHAADPGWTPLFIAAGGVVLEVGGMLQHGAIIAREYGKPCVAGIEGVLDKFTDGQMIEVDGAAGFVRILADE